MSHIQVNLSPILYKDEFFMMMNPLMRSTAVDQKFANKFYLQLDAQWFLVDPVGKVHVIQFNRDICDPQITEGLNEVMAHYGCSQMHWCVMKYVGDSIFDIRVFSHDMVEISYPDPLMGVHTFDDVPVHTNGFNVGHPFGISHFATQSVPFVTPLNPFKRGGIFPVYHMAHTCVLSDDKAYYNQLGLPNYVSKFVKSNGNAPWTIRGPQGQHEISIVNYFADGYARLGRGWENFADMHALISGDIVTLMFTDGVERMIDVFIVESGKIPQADVKSKNFDKGL